MDVLGKSRRSELMGRVKSKGTRPERLLAQAMADSGIKPSKTKAKLPGSPDFVFSKAKLAVFVDGCFWHGCPIHGRLPKSGSEYWAGKIEANALRDRVDSGRLLDSGWMVLRFWEHELATPGMRSQACGRISAALSSREGLVGIE